MQSPFLLRNIPNKICLSYCIKYYHVRHYKEDIPQHVHLHCGVQWEIPHCPPWWGKLWPLPQCPPNSEEGFPVQCKLLLYCSWRMSHTGTILFKDMECWLKFYHQATASHTVNITFTQSFLPKSMSRTLDWAPSTRIIFPSLMALARYGIVSFTNGFTLFLNTCKAINHNYRQLYLIQGNIGPHWILAPFALKVRRWI